MDVLWTHCACETFTNERKLKIELPFTVHYAEKSAILYKKDDVFKNTIIYLEKKAYRHITFIFVPQKKTENKIPVCIS